MSLEARLRHLESQLARPGRCRLCSRWPLPVFRVVDARDPAAKELPPHVACAFCGWRYDGIHTLLIEEVVVAPAEPRTRPAAEVCQGRVERTGANELMEGDCKRL